jgi:hypothetical protein
MEFQTFKDRIDDLRSSGQITDSIAQSLIKLAENAAGAKARAEELDETIKAMEDKKVALTLQVDVVGPDGALKLLGIQGTDLNYPPAAPSFSGVDVPMLGLDDPFERTPGPPQPKPNIESFAPSRGGGRGRKSEGEREAERLKKQYADLMESADQQIKSLEIEARTYGMTEEAAARYRAEQEFILDAKRLGPEVFGKNEEAILAMARALGEAEVQTMKAAEAQRKLQEEQEFYAGLTKSFFSDILGAIRNGEDVWEAFGKAALNVLDRIMDRMLSMALDSIFQGMFQGGTGGGNIFGFLGSLFGGGGGAPLKLMAGGGYVSGPGTSKSDSIPARLSNGEFVVNAAATKRNLGLLHAINSGRSVAMLAEGGMAGMSRAVAGMSSNGGVAINMQVINQAPGVEAVPGMDSSGNPTLIVRQIEGALAKRVGTRQSALGRAANAGLRG